MTWLRNATLPDGRQCDVQLADGAISTVVQPAGLDDGDVDLTGYVLLPSFVEPHAHLDKALTASQVDNPTGDLLGDHGAERVHFPPSYRARLLADEGVAAWPGVNCRDRNRVALEGELAACADAGVAGVHCVTGDHPALGHRPDAMPVFDLDSTDLTALARREGLRVSVAHAPASPPAGLQNT